MKSRYIYTITIGIIMSVLWSCVKIDLEDLPEPMEPTTGNVTLVTAWNNRTEGIDIPADYTVHIHTYALSLTGSSNHLPEMEEGIYPIIIYNEAGKINIEGTTATVETEDNIVDALPGWLFTASEDITYEAGMDKTVTVEMKQQVGQLELEINIRKNIPGSLQSVTASLSGIANSMDFKANTYSGEGLHVVPVLTEEDNKLKGAVRLIGLTTEAQELTLDITYTSGGTQQLVTDISGELAGFNRSKQTALTLTVDMEITSGEAGFEASVNAWEIMENNNGIAW